ncbi:MAG: divergent polysaccharide deacetylase family protein [Oceanicaulis sp.]
MPGEPRDSSPLRNPALAGLAAAVLLAGGVGVLAFIAGGEPDPVTAAADIARTAPETSASTELAEADPFADAPVDGVTLPGVEDTETALAAAPVAAPRRPQAPPAPVSGLYEPGPGGPLPVIAADGRRPDQVYAKPFDGVAEAPTIAVVVGGLGLSEPLTRRAIEALPSEVTLSFAAYSENLQTLIDLARADGHEVLIELPMEPFDYPNNDPGPQTLLLDAAAEENRRRLMTLLSRAAGYAGTANYLGARLGASEPAMTWLFTELEARGLTMIHDGAGRRGVIDGAAGAAGARVAIADRVLDSDPDPSAIDARLLELEALALQNGTSLGSGFAYPATVETVASWAEGLAARGYQLAPASYLVTARRNRAAADAET